MSSLAAISLGFCIGIACMLVGIALGSMFVKVADIAKKIYKKYKEGRIK